MATTMLQLIGFTGFVLSLCFHGEYRNETLNIMLLFVLVLSLLKNKSINNRVFWKFIQ